MDFLKYFREKTKLKPKIQSLSNNIETITAISNDKNYNQIFSRDIAFVIDDKLIEFTTYNSTKVNKCEISIDKVQIEMENNSYLLRILAHREKATTLAAPISGFMDGRIDESMRASIEVELYVKKKKRV